MKHLSISFFSLSVLILAACGGVGDAPDAIVGDALAVTDVAGTELAIDTAASSLTWRGAKVTGAHDGGFNVFDGTVTVAGDTVTGVTIAIDMSSIYSDNDRLTGHLKSDDFFAVATHPEGSFVATQIAPADSGATHLVTGNLTMHGVTNSVTFPATITAENNGVTAQADFIINRRDWNINYDGQADDLIRDDVRIIFDIVAGGTMPATAPATTTEAVTSE